MTNVNGNNIIYFIKTDIGHADLFKVECKKNHKATDSNCNRWVNKNKKKGAMALLVSTKKLSTKNYNKNNR